MSKKNKVIHMSHCLLSLRDGLYDPRTRGEPGYCVGVQNSNVVFVLSGSVMQILPTRVRRRQKMSDNVQMIWDSFLNLKCKPGKVPLFRRNP